MRPDGFKPGKYDILLSVNSVFGNDLLCVPFKITSSDELVLSLDKPFYRPGDTVRMRCFLRNSQTFAPCRNRKVTCDVSDPDGNIIFRGKINIYMNNLPGGSQKTVVIELLAVMPGKTTVPPVEVYEYYNPENKAVSNPLKLTVSD